MVMGRLMGIAPAQAFQIVTPRFIDPQQRVIQRQPRHFWAAFYQRRLQRVTPDGCTLHIAKHPLNKPGLHVVKLSGQWPQFILDQTRLKRAHPRRIDQWLRQVFVHLTRPARQQGQGALALPLWCAILGGFSGKPQLCPDQGQQGARCDADGIQLRLNETVTRMHLARLHQPLPALHALGVPQR